VVLLLPEDPPEIHFFEDMYLGVESQFLVPKKVQNKN
jgi:hypothetical protein